MARGLRMLQTISSCLILSAALVAILATSIDAANPKAYKEALKAKEKESQGESVVGGAQLGKRSQRDRYWLANSCGKLAGLMQTKKRVIQKLNQTIYDVDSNFKLPREERAFQIHTFQIFQKEINESENEIFMAINGLQRALQGNYKDIINMKESSRLRLDALREATLMEEQEYNDLVAAEKKQIAAKVHLQHLNFGNSSNHTKVETILDEIFQEVAEAADKLEVDIEEHAFDKSKMAKGSQIEAVVRIDEILTNYNNSNSVRKRAVQPGMSVLIDTSNNQYVLTKPKDTTVPLEDHHFIKDILLMVVLAAILGWASSAMGFPAMFGYIMTGVILGSDGCNIIKAVVQVESLAEFGSFFILFSVGLEFSPEKIKKVWKVALIGSVAMSVLMIIYGILFGFALHIIPRQSAFIAACLSLSSTPLVVKFLSSNSARREKEEDVGDHDYSHTLLGILVMQDVQLGLLVAIMPTLAGADNSLSDTQQQLSLLVSIVATFRLILWLALAMGSILLLTYTFSKLVVPFIFHRLKQEGNKEILLLATISSVFIMLMITDSLGLSMELGCFLAGAMLSTLGHTFIEELNVMVEPVRDVFACLFFASIGLHIFPTFVAYELTILLSLTFTVVILKFLTGVFVLGILLPLSNRHIKWVVASGLAQVSEFSFVLGSRARRLGILSREVYLLILSVTTLSLLLAPILWRISVWRCRRHVHRPVLTRLYRSLWRRFKLLKSTSESEKEIGTKIV
ncbi:transmembrane and coiled-coil domain-containing protein 3-like isoform X1 [Lytechinus pictus]|uniref:transmembrane and coiled-coil domain-containing protein 3-like isoform X1 n=1 Tax=Lytechinus pictus TaxID=7653 RepID=UPI0030B9BD46